MPTISSVSPEAGPDKGGTELTITGTGFTAGTPVVDFGGLLAKNVTVNSDTELTCTAPRWFAISPTSGLEAGGTAVTLTGTGFLGFDTGAGDAWTIGGQPVTNITVVSDTEMTGETPAGTGTVDVVVTQGEDSATLVNGFEYATWNPSFITTLAWIEADQPDPLSDLSGNDNDFVVEVGSGPSTVADVINGLPVLRFDGGTVISSPAEVDIRDFHVFIIGQSAGTSNADRVFSAMRQAIDNTRFYLFNDLFGVGSVQLGISRRTGWEIWEMRGAGENKEAVITGAIEDTFSDANSYVHPRWFVGGGGFGGSNSTEGRLIGDIYAALKVPVSTPQADIERIQGYFAHKCGLEADLPASHPYKDSPP